MKQLLTLATSNHTTKCSSGTTWFHRAGLRSPLIWRDWTTKLNRIFPIGLILNETKSRSKDARMAGKMLSNKNTICRMSYRFRMRDSKVQIPSVVVESRVLFKCFFSAPGHSKTRNSLRNLLTGRSLMEKSKKLCQDGGRTLELQVDQSLTSSLATNTWRSMDVATWDGLGILLLPRGISLRKQFPCSWKVFIRWKPSSTIRALSMQQRSLTYRLQHSK